MPVRKHLIVEISQSWEVTEQEKTRLSEGLVKAICKELGLKAVKYANLDASDINRKDPATIISKMAGGFLLIERASFMTPETIEKLYSGEWISVQTV